MSDSTPTSKSSTAKYRATCDLPSLGLSKGQESDGKDIDQPLLSALVSQGKLADVVAAEAAAKAAEKAN